MFYSFLRVLAFVVLMPVFFIRVRGKKNLKVPGGSVIIANHTSNWDPILLGFIVKHTPVCYMAKEELFQSKAARFFLLKLNAIPIARGKGDLTAVKMAIKALKDGKMLGVFPEGTRSKTGELKEFEQGAALISMRADVPVIPVYIRSNGYRLFRQVRILVGEPVYLKEIVGERTNSEAIGGATRYLHDKLAEMSKEA